MFVAAPTGSLTTNGHGLSGFCGSTSRGGCHGAQHGRGGFRLSLFGFDPSFDYLQIVQSNEGRRVVLGDAERSILLAKPALVMEHGGGEKIKLHGRDYERIRQSIEDGVPPPNAKTDAEVTRIEVFPARRVMAPGEQQQRRRLSRLGLLQPPRDRPAPRVGGADRRRQPVQERRRALHAASFRNSATVRLCHPNSYFSWVASRSASST